jgi:coenzyme F420 hydrogenase subunit beta
MTVSVWQFDPFPGIASPMNRPDQPALAEQAGSPTLARVLAGDLCAGCGLCAGVSGGAIAMAMSPAGFARPEILGPVASDVEARIAASCPGAVVAPWQGKATEAIIHPYWGPTIACTTGHATDDAVRHLGSSGGMLSALAIHALETGQVDAIVHVRGDDTDPLANNVTISRNAADVLAAAGSRYGPSPALAGIGALLATDARFLFIGKPCDVSALRRLATVDVRVDRRFPFMLSFFCGGMPSRRGSEAIVDAMGLDRNALTAFRYRGMGWPGTARGETSDGGSAEMSYERSWGEYLSGRVQYRCKICPDAVGGVADIACADAWYGGESGYPKFDQRDGRSLAMVRTESGRALIDGAIDAGACVVATEAMAQIDLMQPAQARRKRLVRARIWAARVLGQPVPKMDGLCIAEASRRAGWREQLRNFGGSVRRITQGRR